MIAWFRNRDKGCPEQPGPRGSAHPKTRMGKSGQIAQRLDRALSNWCTQSSLLDQSSDPSTPDDASEPVEAAQSRPEAERDAGRSAVG